MAKRTKAEVVAFLNSLVGKKVPTKPSSDLDGQCVTLEKALLEFLGVPNPYAARGNAKDYGNALLAQGIAEKGRGEVTVCVNVNMGRIYNPATGKVEVYGHIWNDIEGVANYEQNGAVALHTTKNTRPITQATQLVNLDKWLQEEDMLTEHGLTVLRRHYTGKDPSKEEIKEYVGKISFDAMRKKIMTWASFNNDKDRAKKGTLNPVDHLPGSLRDIYKKPATPTTPAKVDKAVVVDYISKNLK